MLLRAPSNNCVVMYTIGEKRKANHRGVNDEKKGKEEF